MGHILERTPGNLRDGLRSSQNASSAFLLHDEPWSPEPTQWGARASDTHGWSGESAFAEAHRLTHLPPSKMRTSTLTPTRAHVNAVPFRMMAKTQMLWPRICFGLTNRPSTSGASIWAKALELFVAMPHVLNRFDRNKGKGKCKSGNSAFPVVEGKGKKGKHPMTAMLAEMTDDQVQQALPAFQGSRSFGKGKGRKTNPLAPNGQVMRCFECGSTEHLARACPRRNPPAAGATTFFANRAIQPSSSPASQQGLLLVSLITSVTTDLQICLHIL